MIICYKSKVEELLPPFKKLIWIKGEFNTYIGKVIPPIESHLLNNSKFFFTYVFNNQLFNSDSTITIN